MIWRLFNSIKLLNLVIFLLKKCLVSQVGWQMSGQIQWTGSALPSQEVLGRSKTMQLTGITCCYGGRSLTRKALFWQETLWTWDRHGEFRLANLPFSAASPSLLTFFSFYFYFSIINYICIIILNFTAASVCDFHILFSFLTKQMTLEWVFCLSFVFLIVAHFLSYSSQDAQQLLADGSAVSPWQQTGVAVEPLQAECCKLQEVVDKMVRFIWL